MRVVVQRVKWGRVLVDDKKIGEIGVGLVVLLGVHKDDSEESAGYLAEKCVNLRIFRDEQQKMNKSALDIQAELLSISQFTLYGDCRRGRRPSFIEAADPEKGEFLYNRFNYWLKESKLKVETGKFGAMMDLEFLNDGPVTLIIESK